MILDSVGPLAALQALLTGLRDGSGNALLKSVVLGVPGAIGNQVGAYVALGAQRVQIKTSGTIMRTADYYVGIAYQVVGSISDPELAVGAILDAFITAIYADLTLGGLTGRVELALDLAKSPLYQTIGGQEYRVLPAIVTLVQYDNYNVTP